MGRCSRRRAARTSLSQDPLPADEEPFLIFANRYYLRKLNLDGSNYTLLKQVPKPKPPRFFPLVPTVVSYGLSLPPRPDFRQPPPQTHTCPSSS